jgi:DNA-binding FadR family transcriptional regulator
VVTDVKPSDFAQATTLHLHRRGGTFRDLLEARQVLEPVMARLAAQRLTPELAERVRSTTQLGRDALEAALEVFSAATAAFHSVVAGTSGNRVLDLYSSALVAIERESVAASFTERAERELTQVVHERIAAAVLSGDGDRAEDLSHRHIGALIRHWEQTQPGFLDEVVQWR